MEEVSPSPILSSPENLGYLTFDGFQGPVPSLFQVISLKQLLGVLGSHCLQLGRLFICGFFHFVHSFFRRERERRER